MKIKVEDLFILAKDFTVHDTDEHGDIIDNKYITMPKDSVWEVERITGREVKLERVDDSNFLVIKREYIQTYFKPYMRGLQS